MTSGVFESIPFILTRQQFMVKMSLQDTLCIFFVNLAMCLFSLLWST